MLCAMFVPGHGRKGGSGVTVFVRMLCWIRATSWTSYPRKSTADGTAPQIWKPGRCGVSTTRAGGCFRVEYSYRRRQLSCRAPIEAGAATNVSPLRCQIHGVGSILPHGFNPAFQTRRR